MEIASTTLRFREESEDSMKNTKVRYYYRFGQQTVTMVSLKLPKKNCSRKSVLKMRITSRFMKISSCILLHFVTCFSYVKLV